MQDYVTIHKIICDILKYIYSNRRLSYSKRMYKSFMFIGIKKDMTTMLFNIKFGKQNLLSNTYVSNDYGFMNISYDIFIKTIELLNTCVQQSCIYCSTSFYCVPSIRSCDECLKHVYKHCKDPEQVCTICLQLLQGTDVTMFACKYHFVHFGCKSNFIRSNNKFKCPFRC